MCNKGKIFDIQRFSTSDGPGIRTVVFFKGCPLNCGWCHNPESRSTFNDIFYKQDICIGCGACVTACAANCHTLTNGLHNFNRENCVGCGNCAKVCNMKALDYCGEEKSVQEIIDVVLRDKPFYEESGGGLTLSGGEPLMQYDFALSILKLAKAKGIHTAIETSGFSNQDLTELNKYIDLWLYDVKLFSEDSHKKYIGVSNTQIFENLQTLSNIGAKIILRCPIIPDINMEAEHFNSIADLANTLKGLVAIHLEPYHPLGYSKSEQLGKVQNYKNKAFLEKSKLLPFAKMLQEKTNATVEII